MIKQFTHSLPLFNTDEQDAINGRNILSLNKHCCSEKSRISSRSHRYGTCEQRLPRLSAALKMRTMRFIRTREKHPSSSFTRIIFYPISNRYLGL